MQPLPRSRQDHELFIQERQVFPVGAKVRASEALHANLARSKNSGRARDPDMTGTVIGHNNGRLRVIVRWDHPEYADKPDHPGCVEHLAARYLELLPEEAS